METVLRWSVTFNKKNANKRKKKYKNEQYAPKILKNDRKAINFLKMQNKNCTIKFYIPWIKFL